ncbi:MULTISPECIES: hypothetical protein [Deinococcus]|nr:hypothetical protein [Deinococcus marmoris]
MKKRPDSHSGRFKGGDIPMANHRKDTPKRPRKPLTPSDIAVIITAIAALLTGFAAVLTALK